MKKFILSLAALAFAGIAANAQDDVIYDFSNLTKADFSIQEAGTGIINTNTDETFKSISFIPVAEKDENEQPLKDSNDKVINKMLEVEVREIILSYKNSAKKDDIIKISDSYLQGNGSNIIITVPNVPMGYYVNIYTSAKSDDVTKGTIFDGTFSASSNTTGTMKTTSLYVDVNEYEVMSFKATEDGDVKIKETKNGFRISKIIVSNKSLATPVEDIVAENASKVVKTIENGQIIIIKNGVKYNVLGQIVK